MSKRLFLSVIVIGGLVGGYFLYRGLRPNVARSARILEWLRRPQNQPEWVMRQQDGGVIVNVVKLAGHDETSDHAAYVASKIGLIGLTRQAARELAKHGIRVHAVGTVAHRNSARPLRTRTSSTRCWRCAAKMWRPGKLLTLGRMAEHYNPDEPLAAALDEFVSSVHKLVDWLRGLPAEAWNRTGRHVLYGEFTLQVWVERALAHIEEHLETIKKAKL